MRVIHISEEQARAFDVCVGCGASKEEGLVVCWECFKRREFPGGLAPLKYFGGGFGDWQERLPDNEAIERLMALTFGGYHLTALTMNDVLCTVYFPQRFTRSDVDDWLEDRRLGHHPRMRWAIRVGGHHMWVVFVGGFCIPEGME
jgi:hypothetical protein